MSGVLYRALELNNSDKYSKLLHPLNIMIQAIFVLPNYFFFNLVKCMMLHFGRMLPYLQTLHYLETNLSGTKTLAFLGQHQ